MRRVFIKGSKDIQSNRLIIRMTSVNVWARELATIRSDVFQDVNGWYYWYDIYSVTLTFFTHALQNCLKRIRLVDVLIHTCFLYNNIKLHKGWTMDGIHHKMKLLLTLLLSWPSTMGTRIRFFTVEVMLGTIFIPLHCIHTLLLSLDALCLLDPAYIWHMYSYQRFVGILVNWTSCFLSSLHIMFICGLEALWCCLDKSIISSYVRDTWPLS